MPAHPAAAAAALAWYQAVLRRSEPDADLWARLDPRGQEFLGTLESIRDQCAAAGLDEHVTVTDTLAGAVGEDLELVALRGVDNSALFVMRLDRLAAPPTWRVHTSGSDAYQSFAIRGLN